MLVRPTGEVNWKALKIAVFAEVVQVGELEALQRLDGVAGGYRVTDSRGGEGGAQFGGWQLST